MSIEQNTNTAENGGSALNDVLEREELRAARARVTFWRKFYSMTEYTLPRVNPKTKEASRNRKRRLARHYEEAEKRFSAALHKWAERFPALRSNATVRRPPGDEL